MKSLIITSYGNRDEAMLRKLPVKILMTMETEIGARPKEKTGFEHKIDITQ